MAKHKSNAEVLDAPTDLALAGGIETKNAVTVDAGPMTVTIRRRKLEGESKCGAIKRLLCAKVPLHIKDIFNEVKDMHEGADSSLMSTIRTLRGDMMRAGAPVTATVDKKFNGERKPPSATILRLRTQFVGSGCSDYTQSVEPLPVKEVKPAKVTAVAPVAEAPITAKPAKKDKAKK